MPGAILLNLGRRALQMEEYDWLWNVVLTFGRVSMGLVRALVNVITGSANWLTLDAFNSFVECAISDFLHSG